MLAELLRYARPGLPCNRQTTRRAPLRAARSSLEVARDDGAPSPCPQRHRHHHRPVISFKELGMRTKQRAESSGAFLESSPPGPVVVPIIDSVSNERHRLTAHCLVLIFKYPNARLPLRLPRYKDRKASAAETCPAPKLPGKSN